MSIEAIKMPKWGLAMEEGKIVSWHVSEGDVIVEGAELVDVETSKITNVCEAHTGGTVRRIVAQPDETLPVGALIAVLAEADIDDAEINAFVEDYQSKFDPASMEVDGGGLEIRAFEVFGRTLRVGVMGEGTQGLPIVLLHGFGGDLNNWMLVQPALAETRPVYAVELPGHGQSSKDVGDGRLGTLATGLVAAVEALGLEQVILVGHSLGGALAIEVSARLGARVAALGLICPAGISPTNLNTDYLDSFVSARRARDLREPVSQLFANPEMVTRSMLDDLVKAKRLDGAEAALALIKDNLKGGDPDYAQLGERLAKTSAPVRLISGQHDKIVGIPSQGDLPDGVLVTLIDEVGHMPHMEKADEIVNLLLELGA